MFTRLFISNRGEIALRLIRTCRRLGIGTVVPFTAPESRAPYVQQADQAVLLPGLKLTETFLDQERLIALAQQTGCEAIHPGYGFLSENSGFSRRVGEAGLRFVGPPPEAIALLGDKLAAKALAIRLGVPVVPGHPDPVRGGAEVAAVAEAIGYPILLKPAAGGGGRGMRVVHRAAELEHALQSAQEETRRGFGDERVFVERFIGRARHVEVQLIADTHGHVLHLGERECSVQRRHQKVIEETPSPAVDPALRARMGELACRLARAAGYTSAGTVEFLLDEQGEFYLLEMNTRLQVEHPVTELVTGLDLVELQLRVAAGEPLPLRQEEVRLDGWAIEARICAEDPARGFAPTSGMVTRYAEPHGEHVRVDSGIQAGSMVSVHYDSLLAKVAAWGPDRAAACDRLSHALNGLHLEGLNTNVDFANAVVNHPHFLQGDLSIRFLQDHFPDGRDPLPPPRPHLDRIAIAAVLVEHERAELIRQALKPLSPLVGSTEVPGLRHEFVVRAAGQVLPVVLEGDHASRHWRFTVDQRPYAVVSPPFELYRRRLKLSIDDQPHMFRLAPVDHHLQVAFRGQVLRCEVYQPREWQLQHHMRTRKPAASRLEVLCPMPGQVTALYVAEGDVVRRGQELLQLEAMKMLSTITAPCDGRITKLQVTQGQTVQTDELLLKYACEQCES